MSQDTVKYPTIIEGKNAIGTMLRTIGLEIEGRAGHIVAGKFAHYYFINVKTQKKYWIKKVHTPFMTFGRQFREYKSNVGETLDREVIDLLTDSDEVFFVYDNAIYSVEVKTFRDYMRDRLNDADHGTQTVSIPISLLERYYDL